MRKLGLIGGTGYESTLVYYRELNRIVNERCGGRSFPEMSLESVDLYKALGYVAADDEDGLTAYLLDKLENLAAGGAEFAALTAGTMHIVFDRLKEKSPLPLVGIPQTVCDEAKRMGYRKVGLMGTIFTMEKDFFKSALTENGIEVIVPDKAQRELINQRITTELELGIVNKSTEEEFLGIIEQMRAAHGIDALILGCTELPLILGAHNCPLPVLDIMAIHINSLAGMILSEEG
ncbi:MAG: amino acid racemase [Ruminococcus sp.]|nr:amino acid racemase [Ruminococcus sp.]